MAVTAVPRRLPRPRPVTFTRWWWTARLPVGIILTPGDLGGQRVAVRAWSLRVSAELAVWRQRRK